MRHSSKANVVYVTFVTLFKCFLLSEELHEPCLDISSFLSLKHVSDTGKKDLGKSAFENQDFFMLCVSLWGANTLPFI